MRKGGEYGEGSRMRGFHLFSAVATRFSKVATASIFLSQGGCGGGAADLRGPTRESLSL